jgi:hypothetical protein
MSELQDAEGAKVTQRTQKKTEEIKAKNKNQKIKNKSVFRK